MSGHDLSSVQKYKWSDQHQTENKYFNKMLSKVIVAFVLFIATASAYEDCGSEVGSIVSLSVSNCDNDEKCVLKRNTNATIEIGFTTTVDSDVIKAVVHGVVLSVPIPFALPNDDGCKDSGVTCPISAGQTYNYKASLPVRSEYPRVTVDVKWELKDNTGKNIVCVLIPSKIK